MNEFIEKWVVLPFLSMAFILITIGIPIGVSFTGFFLFEATGLYIGILLSAIFIWIFLKDFFE
jgi:hypothetical protein